MTAPAPTAFSLHRISHHFGDVEALAGIDLQVRPREFVSLIGPSGCGKSTLLKIAAGLLSPASGEVLLPGQSAPSASPLGEVGYMPQNDLLLPWRTVLDNTIIGLELAGLSRSAARAEAKKHFAEFGLEGFDRHFPSQLSGGMRQRAALLRTLLVPRSFYVLDEPFGKLDSLTRLAMHTWLTRIWQASDAAILFVTHDLDEALFLSDRIYVMSPRPASIVAEFPVATPRPRDHATLACDPVTSDQKAALLRLLRPVEAPTA